MTAQTTTSVDEAFWDLVLADPDLLDAAFHDALADPDSHEPTGPGDQPPTDSGGGPSNSRPPVRPVRQCQRAHPDDGRLPARAAGRVRAPPPDAARR